MPRRSRAAVSDDPVASDETPLSLPRHVGIIMDGNRRWAGQFGLARNRGHEEGLQAAKRVVAAARRAGIRYLSLYTFSTENWKRAEEEVSFLMSMLATRIRTELDFYRENQIRVICSGDRDGLPESVNRELGLVQQDTAEFSGLTVHLLINYGGRDEILRAVKRWISSEAAGIRSGPESLARLDEETLQQHFDHPDLPEPDLIIRTGGQRRISNFLLWGAAYAEFYFDQDLWPDWDEAHLRAALDDYSERKRTFGGDSPHGAGTSR